jgi:hypothetical protein
MNSRSPFGARAGVGHKGRQQRAVEGESTPMLFGRKGSAAAILSDVWQRCGENNGPVCEVEVVDVLNLTLPLNPLCGQIANGR